MRLKPLILTLGLAGLMTASRGAEADQASSELKTKEDRTSYALGLNMGNSIRKESIQVKDDLLVRGIRDGLKGSGELMNEQQLQAALNEFRTDLRASREQARQEAAVKNKKEGEEFLAKNAKRPEVHTTASGLQYEVLKEGSGASPDANDQVKVNYRGTFLNGEEFDSSEKHGGPKEFPANMVIKGWTEALQMMKVGSKWRLYIPSDLAYKEPGRGQIPPNATLIFDVELLEFEPKPNQQPVTSDIIKVPSKEEMERGAQPQILNKEQIQKEMEKARQQQQKKDGK